ncbi:MAG: hypothetical protein A2Z11_03755 [Candidatus Woykebacteria bacterium RBG_16_43_9]|uniref:Uncharacterized protein n=1 Tax=Candidatus Woykebacteria bacterium RBG_16_43_9 TaxID=1802596 RepID=A0A1G1WD10_9BACT|nr:MAG: hypothetical protein A2Z11_03755 [Candidatus Woykebacteria bacterium RBG_16_43_9]
MAGTTEFVRSAIVKEIMDIRREMKLSEAVAKFEDALGSVEIGYLAMLDRSGELFLEGTQRHPDTHVEMRISQVNRRGHQLSFEPVEYAYPLDDEGYFDVFTWDGSGFRGPKREGRITGGVD